MISAQNLDLIPGTNAVVSGDWQGSLFQLRLERLIVPCLLGLIVLSGGYILQVDGLEAVFHLLMRVLAGTIKKITDSLLE